MTKTWRVRKYTWTQFKGGVGYGKRSEAEETIEADDVLLVDGALHFVEDTVTDPGLSHMTVAARVKGEWYAVDRVDADKPDPDMPDMPF